MVCYFYVDAIALWNQGCKRRPFFSDGGSGAKELRLQAAGAISESMMAVEAAGAKEDQAVGPEDDIEDAGNIEEVEQMFSDAFLWMKSFGFWLKFHWNPKLFIHKNASENIICEMVAILSRGRWAKIYDVTWSHLSWIDSGMRPDGAYMC